MSESPTNEAMRQSSGKRRGWNPMVFFLGFLAGFLVALILNEKANQKLHQQKPEASPLPSTERASEPAPAPDEDVRAPTSHEAEVPAAAGHGDSAPQHEMVVTKAMRDRMLSIDFLDLLQDAELHRYRFEGETKGVRLTKIRSGSIYQKAGFRDGDIIEQVNGIAVADIEKKPGKAKQELPSAERVTFKVRRDDKVITISVKVAGLHAE